MSTHTHTHMHRMPLAQVCMDTLHWHNSPLIMSQCGSKGSPINIAQVCVCVCIGGWCG